jgi:hypothetical protein
MQKQQQKEIITKLSPDDVLFGRGAGPNQHEGNIRFRRLIAERKAEYMATSHRVVKAKVAQEIVAAVLRENGRFLKKIEPKVARMNGIPDGVEAWTGVDEDTIMEKTKQSLRQNTKKHKGSADTETLHNNDEPRLGMPASSAQSRQPSLISIRGGSNVQPAANRRYVVDSSTSSSSFIS